MIARLRGRPVANTSDGLVVDVWAARLVRFAAGGERRETREREHGAKERGRHGGWAHRARF